MISAEQTIFSQRRYKIFNLHDLFFSLLQWEFLSVNIHKICKLEELDLSLKHATCKGDIQTPTCTLKGFWLPTENLILYDYFHPLSYCQSSGSFFDYFILTFMEVLVEI